jgi:hypothetical protein
MCKTVQIPVFVDTIVVLQIPRRWRAGTILGTGNSSESALGQYS